MQIKTKEFKDNHEPEDIKDFLKTCIFKKRISHIFYSALDYVSQSMKK